MKGKYRCRAAATAAAALLLVSACAHSHQKTAAQAHTTLDKTEQRIADTVKDPVRAERLAALARQADMQAQEMNELSAAYRRDAKALNGRYDAARAEFDALEERYAATMKAQRERILDTWFAMKEAATPDEWKKIAKHEAQALTERLNAKE
jgi:CHASE3 domain sensor protein